MTVQKTLRFDEDVLEVLRDMEWKEDGRLGVITAQLERGLYVKVNKALELMGGAWNRKLKAHSFTGDPRPQVEGLIKNNGEIVVDVYGWFPTPKPVIMQMLKLSGELYGHVLEPSAGEGHIVSEIMLFPEVRRILAVEVHQGRASYLREQVAQWEDDTHKGTVFNIDFMEVVPFPTMDFVLMNPPFEKNQYLEHALHAWKFLKVGGTLVSVFPAVFGEDYKSDGAVRSKVIARLGDVGMLQDTSFAGVPEGAFKESGTDVRTILFRSTKRPL